ncbi:MAG: hypothetical protein JWO50_620 [Candidatus Kaiserbacteria bacterium]|nr:hypothetical protein [Candidatus Kaiserbacteria bacterium]
MNFKQIQHFLFPSSANQRHPKLFRYEALAVLLLVVSVCELGAMVSTTQMGHGIFASVLPATLTDLTNSERVQNSEPTLVLNDVLTRAAQAKADDMALHQYFAHNSPDGREPWWWFGQAGYAYSYAGENLAIDFSDSREVVDAWMNSPKHRENILKGQYTQIGIGIAQGMYEGHSTVYVVQFFGTPAPVAAAPAKASLTVATSSLRAAVKQSAAASSTIVTHSVSAAKIPVTIATTVKTLQIPAVQTASTTASGQVLGAESYGVKGWAYDTFLNEIMVSPLTFVNNIFYVMTALLLLLLLVGLLPIHAEWIHRYAFANGISAIAVLVFCIFINTSYALSVRVDGVSSERIAIDTTL